MQDWLYLTCGTVCLTLELNNDKWPDAEGGRLAEMWDENREALLRYPLVSLLGGEQSSRHVQERRLGPWYTVGFKSAKCMLTRDDLVPLTCRPAWRGARHGRAAAARPADR